MNTLKEIYAKAIENKWSNKELIAEIKNAFSLKDYFQKNKISLRGGASNKIYICLVALINNGHIVEYDMVETVEYVLQVYGNTYYNTNNAHHKTIFMPKAVGNGMFEATQVTIKSDNLSVKKTLFNPFCILSDFLNDFSAYADWVVKTKGHEVQEKIDFEMHSYVRNLSCLI